MKSRRDLERRVERMATIVGKDEMWIATDATQNDVRSLGLATGLVDFKICAIDATWRQSLPKK